MFDDCTEKYMLILLLLEHIFPLDYIDKFLWFRVFLESLIVVFLAYNSKLLMQTLREKQYFRLMGVVSQTIGEVCVLKEKGAIPSILKKQLLKLKNS